MYIAKLGVNHFSFDMGNDSSCGPREAIMRKTAFGWIVEVTEVTSWDGTRDAVYYWMVRTAREAYEDCRRYVREAPNHHGWR